MFYDAPPTAADRRPVGGAVLVARARVIYANFTDFKYVKLFFATLFS